MTIPTTVYLDLRQKKRITEAAALLVMPRNDLIHFLLSALLKRHGLKGKSFSRCRYQRFKADDICETMFIGLRKDVYEQCQDVRRVFRVSVSFFLAMAVDMFLDEFIRNYYERTQWTYNYCNCFFISIKYHGNDLCYTVSHGKPPN